MNTRSVIRIAAMLLLGSGVAFAADTPKLIDQAKAALVPGEMVLTGNEIKKIHDGKDARNYRVCVKEEKDAAPAKFTFDGKQAVVKPGNCTNVTGMKIDAGPEHTLTGSGHIVVTFHEEKK